MPIRSRLLPEPPRYPFLDFLLTYDPAFSDVHIVFFNFFSYIYMVLNILKRHIIRKAIKQFFLTSAFAVFIHRLPASYYIN